MNKVLAANLAVAGVLAVAAATGSSAAGAADGHPRADPASVGADAGGRWVVSWTSMPQLTEPANLPPAPFTQDKLQFGNSTLRQTVRASIGGRHVRLRFSNVFGDTALPITAVSVALPVDGRAGVSGIEAGSSQPVTFGGQSSVVVPAGAHMVSDALSFPVAPGSNLSVTAYLADGQASNQITSHPGSRTTSYLAPGNRLGDPDLAGAVAVQHWYFLSELEVWAGPGTRAAVIVGDSLTDGRGSTTDMNNRWPDLLWDRLRADRRTADVAIVNQAAGGNRVLHDGLGLNVLARLDRDVLAQSGAAWMFLFEGVNDIGTAPATPAGQKAVTDDLTAAYQQIVVRAHVQGIRVYAATLTPFGGSGYDDPSGYREAARQSVNAWIRGSGCFDAIVDFDRAARDPADPRRLQASIDVGDHLHLNPAGYQLLADAVPAALFTADRAGFQEATG
jgi:lysophospholipase L1-like esterase